MQSDFLRARPHFAFVLAWLACAALGCARSPDLFPEEASSSIGCPDRPSCAAVPEPCTEQTCAGGITVDWGAGIDSQPSDGEPEPPPTRPETAQPSGEPPLETPQPDAGPSDPEAAEPTPAPEPAQPDASLAEPPPLPEPGERPPPPVPAPDAGAPRGPRPRPPAPRP